MRVTLGERGENRGFSKGRDNDVAFAKDDFRDSSSEPRGGTGDCRGWC